MRPVKRKLSPEERRYLVALRLIGRVVRIGQDFTTWRIVAASGRGVTVRAEIRGKVVTREGVGVHLLRDAWGTNLPEAIAEREAMQAESDLADLPLFNRMV